MFGNTYLKDYAEFSIEFLFRHHIIRSYMRINSGGHISPERLADKYLLPANPVVWFSCITTKYTILNHPIIVNEELSPLIGNRLIIARICNSKVVSYLNLMLISSSHLVHHAVFFDAVESLRLRKLARGNPFDSTFFQTTNFDICRNHYSYRNPIVLGK